MFELVGLWNQAAKGHYDSGVQSYYLWNIFSPPQTPQNHLQINVIFAYLQNRRSPQGLTYACQLGITNCNGLSVWRGEGRSEDLVTVTLRMLYSTTDNNVPLWTQPFHYPCQTSKNRLAFVGLASLQTTPVKHLFGPPCTVHMLADGVPYRPKKTICACQA